MRTAWLLALFPPVAALAQDVERGRLLYETHCVRCHDERIHERFRSEVRDFSDLRNEVSRHARETNRSFSPAELEQLVEYLNARHYRFGLAPKAAR